MSRGDTYSHSSSATVLAACNQSQVFVTVGIRDHHGRFTFNEPKQGVANWPRLFDKALASDKPPQDIQKEHRGWALMPFASKTTSPVNALH
jgi:hypothetical protein